MKRRISWLLIGICWLTAMPVSYAVSVAPILQSKEGMVTAAHPLAAAVGAEIPEKGYISKDYARQRFMQIDLSKASNPDLWCSERVGDPSPYENGAGYIDVILEERQKPVIEGATQDESPSTTHLKTGK